MVEIFLSYSHKDESVLNEFLKYTAPMQRGKNAMFKVWYDREMISGTNLKEEIHTKLNEVDSAILFISEDYLSSTACNEEKDLCLLLSNSKPGFKVLPLLVRKCLWSEDNMLENILSLTTDANPISCFESRADAWLDVAKNLKKAILLIDKEKVTTPKGVEKISTITFKIKDNKKFQVLLNAIQEMNIALVTVEMNHFDGNPDTINQAYQISEKTSRILDILHRISNEGGNDAITDVHYISEVDNFERDNLTLNQTIQLINDTTTND